MPTYVYKDCAWCAGEPREVFEKNVPIAERDTQWCEHCGLTYERVIAFTGLTWAPTAGGMR
jgi:predicted nucleic acid-binding Zn ribbon protein